MLFDMSGLIAWAARPGKAVAGNTDFAFDRRQLRRYWRAPPQTSGRSTEEPTLPKVELGTKHTCESCGAKFYDMKKTPPTCPSCGAVVEIETKRKSRTARPEEAKRKPVPVKDAEIEDDEEEVEDIDEDAADALLEDEEDDDDDDIGVGVGDDGEED